MSRRAVLRVVLVVLIAGGAGVLLVREDDASLRDGWEDCTAPQVQEPLPIDSERPTLDLDVELRSTTPQPVSVASGGDDTLLVGSLTGQVTDARTGNVVLNLSDEVVVGAEQGLLDVEFDPDSEWLYVSYTGVPEGASRVRAWRWDGGRPLDPNEGVDIFQVDQPHRWHNGGGIAFGPDGYLYLGLGDGGFDDVQGATNARDLSNVFGAILRIDPTPEVGGYEVPKTNPFVGIDGAAPEIYHFGLRNPWRFSFDTAGRMWIADVGQYCVEEINIAGPKDTGANFGWPGLEGTYEWAYPEDETAEPPVYEYLHEGLDANKTVCSISGGEVYRGAAIPELRGVYVFADLCDGEVRGIRIEDDTVVEYNLDLTIESPVAVVADDDGALYVASLQDDGSLFEIVPS